MRHIIVAATIGSLFVPVIGCANHGDAFAPQRPGILAPPPTTAAAVLDNSLSKLLGDYTNTDDPNAKRIIRDKVLESTMQLIDGRFTAFDNDLYKNRNLNDLGFDLINLGLSFTGTITTGARAKTVLSALVTAVTGTKLAINQDLYNQQSALAISAKMKALRSATAATIASRKSNGVDKYPLFPDGMEDLMTYYRDGTVMGALEGITAGSDSDASKNKANQDAAALNPNKRVVKDAPGRTMLMDKLEK